MKITPYTSTEQKITLEEIIQKRIETKQNIILQKEKISEISSDIFSPIIHATSGKSFLNHFTTGINVVNGIFLGFKLITKFRKFFHKK